MLLSDEISEERCVEHLGIAVLAPNGDFVKVTHVCRTIPMEVWRVVAGEYTLSCAGGHLVIDSTGTPVAVETLKTGEIIQTITGPSPVTEVQRTGKIEELYDLRVDSPDHLYYTEGIESHNSTGLGASELFKLNVIPNYRSLYLAPLLDHVKTLADKLMDMQRGSIYPPSYVTSKGYRNNMYYKESPKGGFLKLLHVLTDPTKIRGNSCGTVVIDEAQDFDAEHLPEIKQVQKAFRGQRMTVFAGTSKSLDTCLEAQYNLGSGGVWHIPCGCKDKWHSLGDKDLVPKMMSVDGLCCPRNGTLLQPEKGQFVHASQACLNKNHISLHLPQVIVPQYARGADFIDIWNDFKDYDEKKFLTEVWGLAMDAGTSELSEEDLKKCCCDKTFEQLQQEYLTGAKRYVHVISGVDWGGSDYEPAHRTKLSYTVHTIYGMEGDGTMVLLYAYRYSAMNYREIAGSIVEAHNKFKAFAMGTDNGGGAYYNAYMRDCGRINTQKLIHFQYTDTKLMLSRIEHPEANLMSLHRTDSLSALIADIKDRKIIFPRWDSSRGFITDCLNLRRNITEAPATGRTIMRYIKHGAKADDFMQATNYACMMKRIINKESLIPNQQVLDELGRLFGTSTSHANTYADIIANMGGHFSG